MAEQISVPERVSALKLLDRVDYEDAFSVETCAIRTPEEWALLLCDSASPFMRNFIRYAHRTLGLRLAPRGSPDRVLGWTVLQNGPDAFVLGTEGGIGVPRIVVLTSTGRVEFATILRLRGVGARIVWAAVAPLHRAVARHLLDHVASLEAVERAA